MCHPTLIIRVVFYIMATDNNREFKFRAWHKIKGVMMTCFALTAQGDLLMTSRTKYGKHEGYSRDNCIVMQYTGLNDCKGVDIYEGDVVLEDKDTYTLVGFEDGRFVSDPHTCSGEDMSWIVEHGCKVVGNIFENPELLEKCRVDDCRHGCEVHL